ncbi:hypothetical protein CBR_g12430 [Chara braunii]|uniref:DDE Tnp4 domain-containing protein n=1 Tax=Chara braunii TaxID=69332 RepID=A0A388JSA3_CHABU|nr:hypothetical protein CBR_g12430 [Chara braunii]|eukprot:GBG60694.1 hypothetical protein CBR_g12430 [Chara braunii]
MQGGRGGGRPGNACDVQKTALANHSAQVSISRIHTSCGQQGQLPARCILASAVCAVLCKRRAAGASSTPAYAISCCSVRQRTHLQVQRAWSLFAWFSSGRVFGGCGRRHAVGAERFPEMDVRGSGHGLREEEIDAVAMAVTVVVVNTMGGMSSSSNDMLMQLRKRRALLQRIAEALDCVATCEAVVQLCAALSSGVFPRQTPRWWIKRWTGRTWEDLRLCDNATDEYYRQKLRMSMAMFRKIVVACAAYVEKKVTHYRMPLLVEQVIAFALYYRWASGESYESGTSAFGIGTATGLQAVHDVTSTLLQAYPDAIKWPVGRRRAQILRAFRDKGFPNCFGAIDCTHIYIDKPVGAPSDNYYDRKHKFSVQAQVVVDLDLRILDVHIGYSGSVHDVRVLYNSQLWRRAEASELFEGLHHFVVVAGGLQQARRASVLDTPSRRGRHIDGFGCAGLK